jgi:hypothetical protein
MIEACLVLAIVLTLGAMVWLLPSTVREFKQVHDLRAQVHRRALAKAYERRRLMLNFLRKHHEVDEDEVPRQR